MMISSLLQDNIDTFYEFVSVLMLSYIIINQETE